MHVLTDSAADLTPEEIRDHNITVAPLYIKFPEGEVNSESLTPDQFYDRLRKMAPHIPTTSQPSSGKFAELYRKLAEMKEEILSIHISSGLSGTIESARLGAGQVKDASIHLFDTLTLSGGQRFQVLAAVQAIKAGWGREAIIERLKCIRQTTEVDYTLETLTYLARGGRIGRVQALAGSLLKIKPVIRVDSDGKYSTAGKERTISKAMEAIRDQLAARYGAREPLWITILHGQFAEQAEALSILLKERLNVARSELLRISPVLGVHTGPGIVGAAAVPVQLMAEIK